MGIHDAVVREYGDKRIPRTRSRVGKSLVRLAMLGTGIVRSEDEQHEHAKRAKDELPRLLESNASMRYARTDAQKAIRAEIALRIKELYVPVFGVLLYGEVGYYVSADVLVDWRREYGANCAVVTKPELPRHGMRGLRLTDAHNAYVEGYASDRRNERGMGRAQNAWRYAHVEGDAFAEAVAYSWLWHGQLAQCRDPHCEHCVKGKARRNPFLDLGRQHEELLALALVYFDADDFNCGKAQQPKTVRHRMPAPKETELARLFASGFRVN